MPSPSMTIDRALRLNEILVTAWMLRNGIRKLAVPSLYGVRLEDVKEATRLVACEERASADGTRTYQSVVESTRIGELFAWAVVRSQMT